MSLAVAVPFGAASAVVYGASIVVQHKVAQDEADDHGPSRAGLVRLIKHPVFLLALAGDFVGFILNLVALSTGQVVVIQPLVVLMLPVALVISSLLGRHRPTKGDYLGVAGVLGGLAVFLALIGEPHQPHVPKVRYLIMTIVIVLLVAAGGALATIGSSRTVRAAALGGAAGVCFGTLAMLVDAASERLSQVAAGSARFSRHGFEGLLTSPRGYVPIIGMVVVGVAGMILTQMSFQVGALGATLPANLAVDPLVAVVLGAVVLREYIPFDLLHLVLYMVCLGLTLAGGIRLANPPSGAGARDPSEPRELSAPRESAAP